MIILIILNYESLEHLGDSGEKIPVRQALQHLRTYICEFRLTDDTEHILIFIEIHPCLAPYRSIHLSEKSRRNIGKAHSPLIYGSCKSHHIGSDAASHCKYESITVSPLFQQP